MFLSYITGQTKMLILNVSLKTTNVNLTAELKEMSGDDQIW